jgi:hypothetical protein
MIWGGQALRVIDDKLSASLSQIQNAKEVMVRTIKQVRTARRNGFNLFTKRLIINFLGWRAAAR